MPVVKLTDEQRRAVVLAALAGRSKEHVGREHGISAEHVRRLALDARYKARAEGAFWDRVRELTSP